MSKLEANFRGQQRHKDASGRTLESRLRTSRYLGERTACALAIEAMHH